MNDWISVEDKLPSDHQEYLVWPIPDTDMNIITAEFLPWNNKWIQERYNGYEWENFEPKVTHWMPLQDPPKGDS